MKFEKLLAEFGEREALKYCVGNTDGEPYSEYEGHFYKAGAQALAPLLVKAVAALEIVWAGHSEQARKTICMNALAEITRAMEEGP